VRAIGPSLTAYGVRRLARSDAGIARWNRRGHRQHDNWQDDPGAAQIQADHLAPSDPRESATIVTLAPGNYTAIVRGTNDTTGVALVESIRPTVALEPLWQSCGCDSHSQIEKCQWAKLSLGVLKNRKHSPPSAWQPANFLQKQRNLNSDLRSLILSASLGLERRKGSASRGLKSAIEYYVATLGTRAFT